MGSILVLAAVLFIGVMVMLAVFSRGGAHELATATGARASGKLMSSLELEAVTRRLLQSMGMRLEREEPVANDAATFVAVDPTPVTGQRLLVQAIAHRDGEPVGSVEVQTALDSARGEGLDKVLLVSPTGFSDAALLAAKEAPVELVDRNGLEHLCAQHLGADAIGSSHVRIR